MARKRKSGTKSPPGPLLIHPDAAGIDIGATEIFVAVPTTRDENPIRSFPTFTQDLNALAVQLLLGHASVRRPSGIWARSRTWLTRRMTLLS